MLNYFKNVKPEDWPAVLLRGAALILIVSHLIGFFLYSHKISLPTALIMGLLLAREMYEDLAQRFFRLKAEEYEKHLEELKHDKHEHKHPNLLIEGRAAMRDITGRKSQD
ncbi:hypothetical protein EV663_10871 [Rhodovulum bhavnagarense]|uniref:Uncharacterized protein n=1 Tax=Rhodovulum bhavnagarense TaxID=992286 RepID=A0A4R2RD24_9RHOB|nr:hypothetical protein [Rhodovulum bhavnagarense]TCP60713.1 hypothetical protein EV663_10871 [Rhodovulum bhavnagarense]